MLAPAAADHIVLRYLAIAVVVAAFSVVALVAPDVLVGLGVLVGPFLLVALATDADRLDLEESYRAAFGPEGRPLPTI